MSFGLKNDGETYQWEYTTLMHDMIHKEAKVYVDDMSIKSKTREGNILAVRKFFERVRMYNMRLNPQNMSSESLNESCEDSSSVRVKLDQSQSPPGNTTLVN